MVPVHSLLAWTLGLLSCGGHVFSRHIPSFAGPYIVFVHRCNSCPSDGAIVLNAWVTHFNPARPYEKQYVWGNTTLKVPFDDLAWFRVTLDVRSNNEWKENAFIFDFPGRGCSSLREHAPTVFNVLAQMAPQLYDRKAPCVFPPGEYIIKNQTISWVYPHFKVMAYGRYRATFAVRSRESRIAKYCLQVDCEVIPKPN